MIGMAVAAMGTRFELVLEGSRAAAEEALQEIERLHERWTRFEPHSFLRFLEREAVRRPVALDAEDWRLFQCALRAHRLSAGAFDIAWAGESGSSADIELDERGRTVRFHAPLQLDMGALAKGHAMDIAGDLLIERGVETALLPSQSPERRAGAPMANAALLASQCVLAARPCSLGKPGSRCTRSAPPSGRRGGVPRARL